MPSTVSKPLTPMQSDDNMISGMIDMLIADLSTLQEEARKLEGFGAQLQSLFVHSDSPNVRDLCSQALSDLQQRRLGLTTLDPIRKSPLYLRPFISACEQKHQRLVPVALTTIAKIVQRKLISHEGRIEIVRMLISRVEKTKDERTLLSALQICLALLQDPSYADDEQGIGQLLSLVLRIHDAHSTALPTVAHTAASTVRQAVALIFDHAMLPEDHVGVSLSQSPSTKNKLQVPAPTSRPGTAAAPAPRPGTAVPAPLPSPAPIAQHSSKDMPRDQHHVPHHKDLNSGMDGLSGREVAALKLLKDLVSWAQAIDRNEKRPPLPSQWLDCKPLAPEFLLDLLEVILRERAAAFHLMPRFTVALRNEVCNTLGSLLRAALAERLPPPETIKVLRCVSALLRKHVVLAPDKCALFFQELLACLHNTNTHVLVRSHVLDIFRCMCAEPLLTYRLFELYDQAIEFDLNAVADMLAAGVRYAEHLLKRAADPHNQYRDEYVSRLDGYYNYRTSEGKDPAHTIMEAHSTSVEHSADADVLPAYLGLDLAACLCSSLEQLAVRVRGVAIAAASEQHQGNGDVLIRTIATRRRTSDAVSGTSNSHETPVQVKPEAIATMVNALWRPITTCADAYLQLTDKRSENSLTLPLVTAYQYIIYAAGVVHAQTALDGMLSQLCAYAITGPEDKARRDAISKAQQYEGGALLLNTLSSTQSEINELWPKNRTVLKAILELSKRLAEDLGSGWMYVLDVINCLDSYLDLPGARWRNENDRPEDTRKRLEFQLLQGEPERERVKPGTGKDLLKEKEQWRAACDEIMVTSNKLSPGAVIGLMSALYEVSRLTLSDSWRQHQQTHQLDMLRQALIVLTANLHLTHELWGIFLSHCMLVLRSVNEKARASALRALDEGIMRALSPEAVAAARKAAEIGMRRTPVYGGTPYMPQHPIASPFRPATTNTDEGGGVVSAEAEARNEDIQSMLLVAVDGLYHEHVQLDVQLGLLKIVVHVLQHYGEDLTLGWSPLLRLLGAASSCKEVAIVTLGWQCVEMLCSDYLYMLPKEHVPKALEVLALYAQQDMILNVSLTAVTMLWNVADTLARSKGVTAKATTLKHVEGHVHSTGDRRDVSEAESVEMLLVAFRALKSLSLDKRPEVRNSAVRTLFMAMGSHISKFPQRSVRECIWDMTLPLITTCHHLSETSSNIELGPSEIGKDKAGNVVTMLMHHSRNTEQKQWEETLTLALSGATKVLRVHLPTVAALDGWQQAWEELMQVIGNILMTPRKGLSSSCTTLISTLISSHASNPAALPAWTWQTGLCALDKGVAACAGPNTSAPLQVRSELLACISAIHAALRDYLAAGDVRMILGWLERFARFPFGSEDTPYISSGLGPIQKATFAALQVIAPPPPEVWAEVLTTLCSMLCPFRLLPYRVANSVPGTAIAASATQSAFATPSKAQAKLQSASSIDRSSKSVVNTQSANTQQSTDMPPASPRSEHLAAEAKALSSLWMSRITELLASWYKEYVPWQIRVQTFPLVVGALSECMAIRHADPTDELWRNAAQAFVAVVQSGLPSINIAAHSQLNITSHTLSSGLNSDRSVLQSPAESTWPGLVRAFEMFLLGRNLPGPLPAGMHPNPPLGTTRVLLPLASFVGQTPPSHNEQPATGPSDLEVQASVLDCLADGVLTSCQYAPHDVRQALVSIIDAGAATPTAGEASVPAAARFSHACMSKLYVLCSRGWDYRDSSTGMTGGALRQYQDAWTDKRQGGSASGSGMLTPTASEGSIGGSSLQGFLKPSPSFGRHGMSESAATGGGLASSPSLSVAIPKDQNARCLQEVAQVALPIFLNRCEIVLRSYVFWEKSAVAEAEGNSIEIDSQLTDSTIHVLELLASLRVTPVVMDALLTSRPELRVWVDMVRSQKRRHSNAVAQASASAERREQLHLLPFYSLCADLVISNNARIRTCVRSLMLALGKELGLPVGYDLSKAPSVNVSL